MNRFLRWLFINGFAARAVNHRFSQFLLPTAAGAYFLILDVWGTEWQFIANNIAAHEIVFTVLLLATLFSQVFKEIGASFSRMVDESYLRFLEEFMILTASVVDFKLKRFRNCAKNLKPSSNTFKAITKPKDQIEYIIDQSVKWLRNSFSLAENEISMTVICISNKTDSPYYLFDSQKSWARTKAKTIINEKSSAAYCLEKGEPVFIADKLFASKVGQYYLSDRDDRMKTGSVYCFPVFVNLPSHKDEYIITIVTYNKRLCTPNDEDASRIAASILREICRRIELELTLLSMRSWQFND